MARVGNLGACLPARSVDTRLHGMQVVDEIFDIDNLVKREKELRHLSRFVKDVFGLKLVVGDEEQARRVQKHLQEMVFSDESLMAHGVPVLDSTRKVSVIEVKDYLTETSSQTKTSGWRALKSVVMWWDTPIEIQLQVSIHYFPHRVVPVCNCRGGHMPVGRSVKAYMYIYISVDL